MPSKGDVLERGDIFFLFRPAVGEEHPTSLVDVQRFYVALKPEQGEHIRLMVVGRKRLPDIDEHERLWGYVDRVADSAAALERDLRATEYQTQTRGERHLPAVRPAAEGLYAISLLNGQMHLSYVLELPRRPAEVQRAFNIAPEASFALSIKNPEAGSPPGAGLDEEQKPELPMELQKEFRERRFEREDVRMLDYPGAEFILVGARSDPQQAYGVQLPTEAEDYDHAEAIRELHMAKSRHPVRPLFEGKWE